MSKTKCSFMSFCFLIAFLFRPCHTQTVSDVCPLLKSLSFPKLAMHGFNARVYDSLNKALPSESGDVNMFFSSAKNAIFRCLCEFSAPAMAS